MQHDIRVLIVDDHEIVRVALKQVLSVENHIKIIGEANCGEDAVKKVKELKPDVVLLDFIMPDMNGLAAAKSILASQKDIKILVVSSIFLDEFLFAQFIQNGIKGFIEKGCTLDEMVKAIHTVLEDRPYVSRHLMQTFDFKNLEKHSEYPFDALSERELQVTILTLEGYTVNDIADKLNIQNKSVQSYLGRILEKLRVENKIKLIHLADRMGLIQHL